MTSCAMRHTARRTSSASSTWVRATKTPPNGGVDLRSRSANRGPPHRSSSVRAGLAGPASRSGRQRSSGAAGAAHRSGRWPARGRPLAHDPRRPVGLVSPTLGRSRRRGRHATPAAGQPVGGPHTWPQRAPGPGPRPGPGPATRPWPRASARAAVLGGDPPARSRPVGATRRCCAGRPRRAPVAPSSGPTTRSSAPAGRRSGRPRSSGRRRDRDVGGHPGGGRPPGSAHAAAPARRRRSATPPTAAGRCRRPGRPAAGRGGGGPGRRRRRLPRPEPAARPRPVGGSAGRGVRPASAPLSPGAGPSAATAESTPFTNGASRRCRTGGPAPPPR